MSEFQLLTESHAKLVKQSISRDEGKLLVTSWDGKVVALRFYTVGICRVSTLSVERADWDDVTVLQQWSFQTNISRDLEVAWRLSEMTHHQVWWSDQPHEGAYGYQGHYITVERYNDLVSCIIEWVCKLRSVKPGEQDVAERISMLLQEPVKGIKVEELEKAFKVKSGVLFYNFAGHHYQLTDKAKSKLTWAQVVFHDGWLSIPEFG